MALENKTGLIGIGTGVLTALKAFWMIALKNDINSTTGFKQNTVYIVYGKLRRQQ